MADRQTNPSPRELAQRSVDGLACNGGRNAPFDRWLSRRLHEAYDNVLRERLPSEMEQLVLQLAANHGSVSLRDAFDQDGRGMRSRRPDLMTVAEPGSAGAGWDG